MPNSRDILAWYQGRPVSHLLHNYAFKQAILNLIYNTTASGTIASLTTTGTSGAATYSAGVLNIPQYSGGGGGGVTSFNSRTGAVVPTTGDYTFAQIGSTPTTLSGYGITNGQTTLTLTTTGTSGAATLSGGTLNIPQYAAGTGTVTSFSAGALSPLFTSSVATASTTPALTFTLSTAAATSIFGNSTGSTAAPAYYVPTSTILNTWFGGTIQSAISLTTTGTSGAATFSGGTLNIPNYATTTITGTTNQITASASSGAVTLSIPSTLATTLFSSTQTSLGTTVTNGVTLVNTTSAASGAQQISPALHMQGQGWMTNTPTSQPVDGWIYMLPVQGSTVAGSSMVFALSQNTGSVTNVLVLNDGSGASLTGSYTATANFFAGSSSGFTWGTSGTAAGMYSDANYEMSVRQGTHACQLQVYNTFTSTSNFEAGYFGFQTNANILSIGTATTGGTLRQTQFIGGMVNMIATAVKRTIVADAAYSVLTTDYLIAYTTLTAARTITLPTAVGVTGQQYIIKDESGNATTNHITVATTSSQTVDGASTASISAAYGIVRVYSNGANWFTW